MNRSVPLAVKEAAFVEMNVRDVIAMLNPYASWKAERELASSSSSIRIELLPNEVVRKTYLDAATSPAGQKLFQAELAVLQALRGCRYVARLLYADHVGWTLYLSYCGDPLTGSEWTHPVQTIALRYQIEIANKYLWEHKGELAPAELGILRGRLYIGNLGEGRWSRVPPPLLPEEQPIQDVEADQEWIRILDQKPPLHKVKTRLDLAIEAKAPPQPEPESTTDPSPTKPADGPAGSGLLSSRQPRKWSMPAATKQEI